MITVTIERDSQGIRAIRVHGHAGYAEYGKDIVCAAVSAVVQTALIGVERVAGCRVRRNDGPGLIEARMERPAEGLTDRWAEAQAILETMTLGLKEIEDGRERYVRVDEVTVGSTR